jgi:hypothetical protein
MNRLIEWRGTLWRRRVRGATAHRGPDGAVLSGAHARELERPTYLRRGLVIDGLATAGSRAAVAAGGGLHPAR